MFENINMIWVGVLCMTKSVINQKLKKSLKINLFENINMIWVGVLCMTKSVLNQKLKKILKRNLSNQLKKKGKKW